MASSIKSIIKWFVPYGVLVLFAKIRQGVETRVSYGDEHTDKTFYVIGRNFDTRTGLMWIALWTLSHCLYALSKGYVPVVDMLNNKSQYSEPGRNVWENYFEQPAGYSLSDIARANSVVLCKTFPYINQWQVDDRERDPWYRDMYQRYIRVNASTSQYIESDFERLLEGKGDVLGVLCRGTDYLRGRPSGHLIQPQPEAVIAKAKAILSEKNCSSVYLATEDQDVFELFQAEFGDKLITNSQLRFKREDFPKTTTRIADLKIHRRDRDKYLTNLEYLSSLHLLSRCRYFIGGNVGGTKGVYYLNPNFEYDYVWHLGRFP